MSYLEELKNNIIIREIPLSKLNALSNLYNKFCIETAQKTPFPFSDKPLEKRTKELSEMGHIILVAYSNEVPIGYIIGTTQQKPQARLRQLFIKKEFRGQGIADDLFKRLMQWFKSKDRDLIYVSTMYQNKEAKAFYLRMGFIGEIVMYRHKIGKGIKT